MAESAAAFVQMHRADWDGLEALLTRQKQRTLTLADLEVLDQLYRRANADLARAQSRYPGTDVQRFLNQLCSRAYGSLYRPAPTRWKSVLHFFRRDFPRTLRASSRPLGLSASIFALGIMLGALVMAFDPVRGEAYLIPAGVRHAVASHQIWTDTILSVAPPGLLASQIATNNLTVLVTTFAFGLTYGLGTVFLLLMNGLSIGALSLYCIRGGLGGALFDFVLGHGPVELSTLVVGGAAGLIVAQALIDPGELPRRASLQAAGRIGVKLVVGAAPFLGAIGIVEGFVSPGSLFGQKLKLALGCGLGLAFWAYLLGAGRGPEATGTQ